MENITVNIEFRMPDIPANVTAQELEAMKQERTLYPSRVVQTIMEKIMTDGMEVISSHILRDGNIHAKREISVPKVR